jgi:hypothetical protein
MTAEAPPAPPPRRRRPDAGGASTLALGPRRLERITTAACLGVLALYVSPLWQSLTTWGGTFDWGYFFFLAEVDRKTVVELGQFSLWNPYYCGGAVHLANPQTYFLSPTFLFIWAFGTPLGIRLTLTPWLSNGTAPRAERVRSRGPLQPGMTRASRLLSPPRTVLDHAAPAR